MLRSCSLVLLALVLGGVSSAAAAELLTEKQIAEGWIALFDGETLYGWEPTSKANWRVENGVIRVDEGEEGWLMTTSEFSEFDLDLEFRCPPQTNSGVFLRSAFKPTDPAKDCLEYNIAPKTHAFPTGRFVGGASVGQTLEHTPIPYKVRNGAGQEVSIDPWDGKWHRIRIQASSDGTWSKERGYEPQIYNAAASIDDFLTSAVASPGPAVGRIGLQFREGPIAFRNIRLRPRNLNSIFNGKDLSGWNTNRADQSKFSVNSDRELAVTNGPGQLESNEQFGDFVLQLECKVNGDGLNSGIFFRSIPGDKMMGYESQIQNAIKNGDPTQPVDAGTGAIYRRTVARRVVSADHQWFTNTIVATGPHIAVWVNGYQVTDWTDERPPDENPRRGLRLEPGTLIIQGHDPTTNLLFRNLRAVEIP